MKKFKKITAGKLFIIFLLLKIAIYLSLGDIMDAQVAAEAFIPQKRTSSTSKHETSLLFLCGSVLPSWIRILTRTQQLKLMRILPDPDPQP